MNHSTTLADIIEAKKTRALNNDERRCVKRELNMLRRRMKHSINARHALEPLEKMLLDFLKKDDPNVV